MKCKYCGRGDGEKCKHCGEEIELTMTQGWLHVIPRWPGPPKVEKTCRATVAEPAETTVAEPAEEIPWGWICRVCKTRNEEWRDQCRHCQVWAWSKIVDGMTLENPQTEGDLRETRAVADTEVYHPSWRAMARLILRLYKVKK